MEVVPDFEVVLDSIESEEAALDSVESEEVALDSVTSEEIRAQTRAYGKNTRPYAANMAKICAHTQPRRTVPCKAISS